MNFTKFVRTTFLQNTSGLLPLSFHALNQRFFKLVSLCNQEILTSLNLRLISSSSTPKNVLHCGCFHKFIHSLKCKFFTCICRYFFRYDPNTDIPMDVEYENDRVLFIKSVAQFMVWLM